MKSEKELVGCGKYLSLILRHKPEEANIVLDKNGWTNVEILIDNIGITYEELNWIVVNNNKKRFTYNDDKTKIRASQGHSIVEIEIDFEEVLDVPEFLYHGTSKDVLQTILQEGIKKMNRNYVHLSKDKETSTIVGNRKGNNLAMLKIKAKELVDNGNKIYISKNGVYLTDFVAPQYLILVL